MRVSCGNPIIAEALSCDPDFVLDSDGVEALAPDGPVKYSDYKRRLLASQPVAVGGAVLSGRTLRSGRGQAVLTDKEAELLEALAGGPLTRAELMDRVFGYGEGVESHTLETHISRLRATDPNTGWRESGLGKNAC